ncbi:MAG: hypothetical protein J3R72DRAFT_528328 [Linnemannia gamsii]|nr:MAG: hypothetical protein J3R72DRAFT_528328 [Linnemannia gamsii]
MWKRIYHHFHLLEPPALERTPSRLQYVFAFFAFAIMPSSFVIAMYMNCPHGKVDYNRILCKPIQFHAGDQIQAYSNYVWQVRDPFEYIGQDINITGLRVAEFLQENEGHGYVREMMLARMETHIKSSNVSGGWTYFDIFRQRTYKTADTTVGRLYCSGTYGNELDPLKDCIGNTAFIFFNHRPPEAISVSDLTMYLAEDVLVNKNIPPFQCTSCFDYKNISYKFSDVFGIVQSFTAISAALMSFFSILFVFLIQTCSTEAKRAKRAKIAEASSETFFLIQTCSTEAERAKAKNTEASSGAKSV